MVSLSDRASLPLADRLAGGVWDDLIGHASRSRVGSAETTSMCHERASNAGRPAASAAPASAPPAALRRPSVAPAIAASRKAR